MALKGIPHEVVKRALLDQWIRVRPDEVRLAPETRFRLSEDTYLEPDIVIYPRISGLRGLSGANVLLVVEIADSSLRYGIGRKGGCRPALASASFGSLTRLD
jgi:Uma2 family endonuclease